MGIRLNFLLNMIPLVLSVSHSHAEGLGWDLAGIKQARNNAKDAKRFVKSIRVISKGCRRDEYYTKRFKIIVNVQELRRLDLAFIEKFV